MLLQLTIRNFALIDELSLEFTGGLNVLTGETGAGKSILLDALRLALGERMDRTEFLLPGKPCVIEAAFSADKDFAADEKFAGFFAAGDECLILKREISPEGKSKCLMNGQIVNLSLLREAGQRLIEFHGQNDQQTIFLPDAHRGLLDRLAGLQGEHTGLTKSYAELFRTYKDLRSRHERLLEACQGKQRRLDLLRYQIDEIEKIAPRPEEEEELKTERIRLSHAQKLFDITGAILGALDQEDISASSRVLEAFRQFQSWIKIDESAEPLRANLENVQTGLEELLRDVRDYQEKLSFDEGRLDEIQQRLDQLETLKRKYGGTLTEVLAFFETSKQEYDELVDSEIVEKDLQGEMAKLLPELDKKASEISKLRKRAAQNLKTQVERELKDLAFLQAQFECRLSDTELAEHGKDHIEFYLSPNPGHELKPLAKVASGGEASRILLALKRALARVDNIPCLIFDEIDANIGGRLGETVGRKLREIASERQVLLITHLPQIASFSERHFKVIKTVFKGATRVRYELLEGDDRVKELAQMMSGSRETEISRSHAKEMIKTASR
ncbi:MAG TPA: DNA repair protein RecN [Verrucomicrobiae bacterium]|nr:DNA repair protein RecN [Verrucomicrobiae bacterium]